MAKEQMEELRIADIASHHGSNLPSRLGITELDSNPRYIRCTTRAKGMREKTPVKHRIQGRYHKFAFSPIDGLRQNMRRNEKGVPSCNSVSGLRVAIYMCNLAFASPSTSKNPLCL